MGDTAEARAAPGGVETITDAGLEAFAPYLMNRILRRYNSSVDAAVRQAGLTVSRLRVLAALAANGRLTVNELAVFSVSEQSATSRLVDQMTREGLVLRNVSETDSRVRQISLTDEGRAQFERAFPQMLAAESSMLEGLDSGERAEFLRALRKILGNIRQNPF